MCVHTLSGLARAEKKEALEFGAGISGFITGNKTEYRSKDIEIKMELVGLSGKELDDLEVETFWTGEIPKQNVDLKSETAVDSVSVEIGGRVSRSEMIDGEIIWVVDFEVQGKTAVLLATSDLNYLKLYWPGKALNIDGNRVLEPTIGVAFDSKK